MGVVLDRPSRAAQSARDLPFLWRSLRILKTRAITATVTRNRIIICRTTPRPVVASSTETSRLTAAAVSTVVVMMAAMQARTPKNARRNEVRELPGRMAISTEIICQVP